jgi:hypothetical protein
MVESTPKMKGFGRRVQGVFADALTQKFDCPLSGVPIIVMAQNAYKHTGPALPSSLLPPATRYNLTQSHSCPEVVTPQFTQCPLRLLSYRMVITIDCLSGSRSCAVCLSRGSVIL